MITSKDFYSEYWGGPKSDRHILGMYHLRELVDEFVPFTSDNYMTCPHCDVCIEKWPSGLIQHLNDSHKLTFSEIADWLETSGYDVNLLPKED